MCRTECLPRKELYEAWEVARRARRRFRGGRVVDLACGHGLVAHLMLLLDDTSPIAHAVDTRIPASAATVAAELVRTWPRIAGRVVFEERPLAGMALGPDDVVVSVHACGALTDDVLDAAIQARTRVVVLPCCQVAARSPLFRAASPPTAATRAARIASPLGRPPMALRASSMAFA